MFHHCILFLISVTILIAQENGNCISISNSLKLLFIGDTKPYTIMLLHDTHNSYEY